MYKILMTTSQQQKESENAYAMLTFRSGAVQTVHEWLEVRTNLIKVSVKRGERLGVMSFLPEAVEAVEMLCL